MALVLTLLAPRPPRPGGVRAAGRRGFTMVEVLIAMFLLLVVAVGLVPLFTKAISSNRLGQDATDAVSAARSQLEELMQLPLNDPRLTIVAGTQRVTSEHYALGADRWTAGPPPAGTRAVLTRTTRVRQFDVVTDPNLTTPLASTAPASQVNLKEITVTVSSDRGPGGPLGRASRPLVVRALKAR